MASTPIVADPPTPAIRNARGVKERWLIRGKLEIVTPALLGNGERGDAVDLPLHVDAWGAVVLPGDSLAGALRNYLRERECGYFNPAGHDSLTELLFGQERGSSRQGKQSALIVEDAFCEHPLIERRDGVRLEQNAPVAADKAKYDYELLSARSFFDLEMELAVTGDEQDRARLAQALGLCLQGLEREEIHLGAKKSRGLGRCKVTEWKVWRFDLSDPEKVRQWLACDHWKEWDVTPAAHAAGKAAAIIPRSLSGVDLALDRRRWLSIDISADLADAILIRSSSPSLNSSLKAEGWLNAPDQVHLKSRRGADAGWTSVLPGTSLAGAWRTRCRAILRTLAQAQRDPAGADALVQPVMEAIFGPHLAADGGEEHETKKAPHASRVLFEEQTIPGLEWVVASNRLDPLLQGSYAHALFHNQVLFSNGEPAQVSLRLKFPSTPEPESIWSTPKGRQAVAGLLLLCLKDFWNDDLAIGGRSSVGYGYSHGRQATLRWRGIAAEEPEDAGDAVNLPLTGEAIARARELNQWVKAIPEALLARQHAAPPADPSEES